MKYDCLFAFRRLINGVLLVRRVGQPLNENQSWRHKPLSQVCHGFVEVQSLVAKIESALWSQLSPEISAQFDGQFFVDCRQWFRIFLIWYCLVTFCDRFRKLVPFFNQSDNKPRTKRAWPLVFSRASDSLPVLTFQLYNDFSNCYQLSVQKPKQKLSQLTTNQKKCYHHYCPVRTESLRRGKTRVIKVGLVFFLHLIGWNGGASFLDQSKSKVKQNRCNSGSLSIINWKVLYSTC